MRSLQRLLVLLSLPCAVGADDPEVRHWGFSLKESCHPPRPRRRGYCRGSCNRYRGGRLFAGLQCQGCHVNSGIGGDVGPALDRLGWKVSHSWLVAALSDSATQGLSPESHPYVLSVRDATDLSPFLVRRFSPPGAPLRM